MLDKHDDLIQSNNNNLHTIAALVKKEYLKPDTGHGTPFYPPTFAACKEKNFDGGYIINNLSTKNGSNDIYNECIIDTMGSQANRIEPIFAEDKYRSLIPQIVFLAGEDGEDNRQEKHITEVPHRAGDAIFRCSSGYEKLQEAIFSMIKYNNHTLLAKLAPTSMFLGAWGSRDKTQFKLPRIVSSTVRAENVSVLNTGAVYSPALNYNDLEMLNKQEKIKYQKQLSKQGFSHCPSYGAGGVRASGDIYRLSSLNLTLIRKLKGSNDKETLKLQRYIFGLTLVYFTATFESEAVDTHLRQGCNLTLDPDKENVFEMVQINGTRKNINISHNEAIEYTRKAAKDFENGEDRSFEFKKDAARKELEKVHAEDSKNSKKN